VRCFEAFESRVENPATDVAGLESALETVVEDGERGTAG
jgi:hypothetical protein